MVFISFPQSLLKCYPLITFHDYRLLDFSRYHHFSTRLYFSYSFRIHGFWNRTPLLCTWCLMEVMRSDSYLIGSYHYDHLYYSPWIHHYVRTQLQTQEKRRSTLHNSSYYHTISKIMWSILETTCIERPLDSSYIGRSQLKFRWVRYLDMGEHYNIPVNIFQPTVVHC